MRGLKTVGLVGMVALAAILFVLLRRPSVSGRSNGTEGSIPSQTAVGVVSPPPTTARMRESAGKPSEPEAAVADDAADPEPPMTAEERAEAEGEKRIDAFDALTDKWMEPAPKGVSLADVDAFVKQFSQVPKARKEECLQRALNLIPDENVMLLAGILMDKSQDKSLVELVFNDILNRDEGVKKPIMLQVFKDKTHPCWADTAWILDVTGEMPGKK